MDKSYCKKLDKLMDIIEQLIDDLEEFEDMSNFARKVGISEDTIALAITLREELVADFDELEECNSGEEEE